MYINHHKSKCFLGGGEAICSKQLHSFLSLKKTVILQKLGTKRPHKVIIYVEYP